MATSGLRLVHFVISSKAVKTVRPRVSRAVCVTAQEPKTTVDRKKTRWSMVPTIRTTVRHVRWDAAEAAGRADPGWMVPTRERRGAIVNAVSSIKEDLARNPSAGLC